MHPLALLTTLLLTTVLAAPHPQYALPLAPTTTQPKPPILTVLPSPSSPNPVATPTSPPAPDRELAGVFICEHINWGGQCEHMYRPTGTSDADCTVLDGQASSIGPDEGWTCLFYTNAFCRALASDGSDFLRVEYPGVGDLGRADKGDWNDRVRSYWCVRKE